MVLVGVWHSGVQHVGQNEPVASVLQEKVSRLEAELDEERSTVELLTERMNRGRDQVPPSLALSPLKNTSAHPCFIIWGILAVESVHGWCYFMVSSPLGWVERSQGSEWKKES